MRRMQIVTVPPAKENVAERLAITNELLGLILLALVLLGLFAWANSVAL